MRVARTQGSLCSIATAKNVFLDVHARCCVLFATLRARE